MISCQFVANFSTYIECGQEISPKFSGNSPIIFFPAVRKSKNAMFVNLIEFSWKISHHALYDNTPSNMVGLLAGETIEALFSYRWMWNNIILLDAPSRHV
jgi:hypothetical protein